MTIDMETITQDQGHLTQQQTKVISIKEIVMNQNLDIQNKKI